MKKEFIYKPIMHEPHSVRWPNFERNFYAALWIAILLLILGTLVVYRLEFNERARAAEQQKLEQQAIDDKHAVEVIP